MWLETQAFGTSKINKILKFYVRVDTTGIDKSTGTFWNGIYRYFLK